MAKKKIRKLKLILMKSRIGRLPIHKATLEALGLRKINQSVEIPDNPSMRGMIRKVEFLLNVEEVS